MVKFTKLIFSLLLSLFICPALFAQGIITGTVTDAATKLPIPGATVLIAGTTKGAATDADGGFRLQEVAAGVYTLEVSMLTYTTIYVTDVSVHNGVTTKLEITLAESAEQVDEVVVTAVRRTNTENAINVDIRNSMMVVSGISSQAIARTQDRDAGEVVRRIPGISIIDDKFVIARGLSQRYNNVWINNAAVPSSEADSRAFSFDIIPAGQIESILILKSPAPEIPADFTGGFIRITTKDMPDDNAVTIQYSTGINTSTHFKDFRYNKGGASEAFGFMGRKRMMQGGIGGAFDNNNSKQVNQMTRSGFNNDWMVRSRTPIPDQRFSAAFGKGWTLAQGQRMALNGAVNYSYTNRTYTDMENSRFGIYNKREDKPEYLYKYTDAQYQTNVRLGAMLNLSYANDHSRYYIRNIFNQISQDKYTFREGWQNISSLYNQQKAEYYYSSRTTYNGQVAGSHNLGSHRLNWTTGYSYANRNLPDRRIINLLQNDIHGDVNYGKMRFDQNSVQRDYTHLAEHIASAGIDYEYTFGLDQARKFTPKLKAGAYGEYRTREYRTRAFTYRYDSNNLPADFAYGDVVNDILQPANYGVDKLYIYNDSDNRNSYKGTSLLAAAYAAVQISLGSVDVYAGVRFEHNKMDLTSYTRRTEWASKVNTYDYNDLFPSVNAAWKFHEKHQLRAAYGMSTNRPEFREVSSSVYYDFDLFSSVMGNPNLKAAYIQNCDIRYEWYPSVGENVSLSLFYKHFRNPIETAILDAGGSYTYTFENADRANVYGIELDARKNLDFMGLRNFSLTFNVSLIKSRVNFLDESLEHDRPMQGQSPYIVNTGLFYQPQRAGLTIGVLYNRIGKRIIGIGRTDLSSGGSIDNDIPDMYEMPRNTLDIVVSKRMGKAWELKLSVKDVLNEDVRFCQFPQFIDDAGQLQKRTQTTKIFKPGCGFTLGVSARF
ncbi:MAG: TonB-dependent receptor [Alistipes sp.]